jgi:hypothetical protein
MACLSRLKVLALILRTSGVETCLGCKVAQLLIRKHELNNISTTTILELRGADSDHSFS